MLVANDRTAGSEAVLIEVIGTLRAIVDLVDVVDRVELFVAVIIECRAVKVVRSRLRDHVDHRPTRPPVFG